MDTLDLVHIRDVPLINEILDNVLRQTECIAYFGHVLFVWELESTAKMVSKPRDLTKRGPRGTFSSLRPPSVSSKKVELDSANVSGFNEWKGCRCNDKPFSGRTMGRAYIIPDCYIFIFSLKINKNETQKTHSNNKITQTVTFLSNSDSMNKSPLLSALSKPEITPCAWSIISYIILLDMCQSGTMYSPTYDEQTG